MPSPFQCIGESSGEKDGIKPLHPGRAAGWSERLSGMWLITDRLRNSDAINFQGWDLLHWIQCLEFSRKLWKQTWGYSTAIRNSSALFPSPRTQVPNFFSYLFFLSTLILIFAVNDAVLLAYSKLSLVLRDHCIQGQTALSLDKASLQCPEWVVLHQCHHYCPSCLSLP